MKSFHGINFMIGISELPSMKTIGQQTNLFEMKRFKTS